MVTSCTVFIIVRPQSFASVQVVCSISFTFTGVRVLIKQCMKQKRTLLTWEATHLYPATAQLSSPELWSYMPSFHRYRESGWRNAWCTSDACTLRSFHVAQLSSCFVVLLHSLDFGGDPSQPFQVVGLAREENISCRSNLCHHCAALRWAQFGNEVKLYNQGYVYDVRWYLDTDDFVVREYKGHWWSYVERHIMALN